MGDDGGSLSAHGVRGSFSGEPLFRRDGVDETALLFRPKGRKVVLGVHSLSQAEDTKQMFDILELHNHPDYNELNYDNDIALIKVSLCCLSSPAEGGV